MTANKIKMYSHSWVTELSSITKWHIQFTVTVSYSVTAWLAVHHHHVWLCLVIKLQPSKTVLLFRVMLSLPFIFIVFPVTSLSFIICDFFAFLEVFSYRECAPTSLLSMPAPDYQTELWEVSQCTPSNTNRSRLDQSSECTLKPEGEIDSRL